MDRAGQAVSLRVLLVAGAFPPRPCGVGDYAARLAEALARQGLTVAVLTQDEHRAGGSGPPPGVTMLREARRWGLAEWPGLMRCVRAWCPDVVHIQYPSLGFDVRLLPALLPWGCRRLGARVVQTWHEPWRSADWFRFALQRRAVDALVFVRPGFVEMMPDSLRGAMPPCPQRLIANAGAIPPSRLLPAEREVVRNRWLRGRRRLVVFFGFIYPEKGVEQLFEIADPSTDALVIAGGVLDEGYRTRLGQHAAVCGWGDRPQYPGFLAPDEAADLMAVADAVVLPFLSGGGEWNTSIHGALAQGTLVITTSRHPMGDDPQRNLFSAAPGDTAAMKAALDQLAGRRVAARVTDDDWRRIAQAHERLYRELVSPLAAGTAP